MEQFRSDINGLRALAVLAVVLFHARVPFLGGGFAGVDIFLVISGFLMTKIILGGLECGDFSLFGFWAARARRIVPALAALCAVLALAGWFLIDPITYAAIGDHVAASLLFLSNIQFWRESGYFDQAAETKWLLHTWSLSLEWQFYLIYPLVLVATRRFLGPRVTTALLWLGVLVSVALSVIVTAWRPAIAFYMLPTRAWEMIGGGLVFVHGASAARIAAPGRRILELAGMALVLASLATIRSNLPWPSYWAILPVAGTAAVIFADRRGASVLNLRAIQALGRCSYSVYLWHWPVIVAFRYAEWASRPWAVPTEIGLGLALGALSYRMVERPSQAWLSRAPLRRVMVVAAPAFAVMALWSAADVSREGFIDRSRQPRLMADYVSAHSDWDFPEHTCARGGRDRSVHVCRLGTGDDTLVIGDSHANQWFVRAADHQGADTFVTRDGCPPLPRITITPGADCPDFYRFSLKTASEGHFKRIVFASFWQSYIRPTDADEGLCIEYDGACVAPGSRPEAVAAVFEQFAWDLNAIKGDAEIVLVLPDLEPPGDMPLLMAKRAFFGHDASDLEAASVVRVRAETEQVRAALQKVALAVGAKTVDPLKAECGTVECRYVDAVDKPLFRDSNHLRSSVVRAKFDFLDPYLTSRLEAVAPAAPDIAWSLKPALP